MTETRRKILKRFCNQRGLCECCGHADGTFNPKVCDGYILPPGYLKCRKCLAKNVRPKDDNRASENHDTKITHFLQLITGKAIIVIFNAAGRSLVHNWRANTPIGLRNIPVDSEVDKALVSDAKAIYFTVNHEKEAKWLKSRCVHSKKEIHVLLGTIENLYRPIRDEIKLRFPTSKTLIHFNTSGSMVHDCLPHEIKMFKETDEFTEMSAIVAQETVLKTLGHKSVQEFASKLKGRVVTTIGQLPRHGAIAILKFPSTSESSMSY